MTYQYRTWATGPCWYCGIATYRMGPHKEHSQKYTRDHLIPARFRDTIPDYVPITVTCCYRCNQLKGQDTAYKFLLKFHRFPRSKRKIIDEVYSVLRPTVTGGPNEVGCQAIA